MRPLIGITADIDDNGFSLRCEYAASVEKAGGQPLIVPPLDRPEEVSELIDGLLLSGGGDIPPEYYGEDVSVPAGILRLVHKQRVDYELSLLKSVIGEGKPVLGICLGMQLVNVASGGSLYQDIGLQVNNAFDHRESHKIEIIRQTPLRIPLSACSVNSTHHQAVKKQGQGLETFAVSEDGIIEGFYKKDYPFLFGVQWHPERIFYDKLSLWLFETFIKKSSK